MTRDRLRRFSRLLLITALALGSWVPLLCGDPPDEGPGGPSMPVQDQEELPLWLAFSTLALGSVLALWRRKPPVKRRSRRQLKFRNATFIVRLLLPSNQAEALIGDLEERHRKIAREYGQSRAKFWYYVQVLFTIWPLAAVWIKRAVGTATVVTVAKSIWRIIGG